LTGYCASVLEEFVKSERGKNRSLSVTYCVAGRLAGDDRKVTNVQLYSLFYTNNHFVA